MLINRSICRRRPFRHAGLPGGTASASSSGDLAGSWDDIMVLFRMARHFTEGSGVGQAMFALTISRAGRTGPGNGVGNRHGPDAPSVSMRPWRPTATCRRCRPRHRYRASRSQHRREHARPPRDKLRDIWKSYSIEPAPAEGPGSPGTSCAIRIDQLVTTPWELRPRRRVNRALSPRAIRKCRP